MANDTSPASIDGKDAAVAATPAAASPSAIGRSTMRKLVLELVRPYHGWLAIVFIAMLIETAMSMAGPWPLKVVIDNVLGSHPLPEWLRWIHDLPLGQSKMGLAGIAAVGVVLVAIIGAIASYIDNYYTESVGQWVANDLRIKIYDHLQRMSQGRRRCRAGDTRGTACAQRRLRRAASNPLRAASRRDGSAGGESECALRPAPHVPRRGRPGRRLRPSATRARTASWPILSPRERAGAPTRVPDGSSARKNRTSTRRETCAHFSLPGANHQGRQAMTHAQSRRTTRQPMSALGAAIVLAGAIVAVGCAPDSVRSVQATGFNAYLKQLPIACRPLIIGSQDIGNQITMDATGNNDYDYFLDVTSKLYYNRMSPDSYRQALVGFFGAGTPNERSFECIFRTLPPDRPNAPIGTY